jgi:hypothetical protein
MLEYKITMKTLDNEEIGTHVIEEKEMNQKWSEMIRKAESRMDIILTLSKRFVDKNPSSDWLEIWKQQRQSFLFLSDKLVIGNWETIAEINTSKN